MDKTMVLLSVNSPFKEILPWGSEPIYCNEELLGSVTSVAYSHSINKALCLGMITSKCGGDTIAEKEFQVAVSGGITKATLLNN